MWERGKIGRNASLAARREDADDEYECCRGTDTHAQQPPEPAMPRQRVGINSVEAGGPLDWLGGCLWWMPMCRF